MQYCRGLAIAMIVGALYGNPAHGQSAPAAPAPPISAQQSPPAAAQSPPAAAQSPPAAAPSPPAAAQSPPAAAQSPEVAAPSPEPVLGPEVPVEVPPPPDALALAKEGRRLLKAKETAAAVAKLKESVELASQDKLDPELQASLYYIYGLALLRANKDELALQQFQTSVTLDPKDSEVRVMLATQLLEADKPERAKAEAELALKLGLTDKEDLEAAQKVIKDANSVMLHDRLVFSATASMAYDSDVLQGGTIIQIANKSLSKQSVVATKDRIGGAVVMRNDVASAIVNNYLAGSPPTVEWDLPINLDLDVIGRLFSKSGVELWLGYRLQQTFMSSIAFDHDDYNFQQQEIPLRLELRPTTWFFLRLKAEGFANFTGVKDFSPYQGGLNTGAEAWFTESLRWKTRLVYQHQLRRSFDQSKFDYLNGDRDEAKLIQELRLRGKRVKARGSLGYRFRSDRSGVFTTSQDYDQDTLRTTQAPSQPAGCDVRKTTPCVNYPTIATDPNTRRNEVNLGSYSYSAPLSYFAHELSTRWALAVPGGAGGALELAANFSWEYVTFPDAYTATFTQQLIQAADPDVGNWPVNPKPTPVKMPDRQRHDNLFTTYAGVIKRLPRGLSLELSYTFYKNISTIANFVDNRSYEKHVVQLAGYYLF